MTALAAYLVLAVAAGVAYFIWRHATPLAAAGKNPAAALDAALLDELLKELAAGGDAGAGGDEAASAPLPYYPPPGVLAAGPGGAVISPLPVPGAPAGGSAPAQAAQTPNAPAAPPVSVPSDLAALAKKLSPADRLKAARVLLARLSPADINTLSGMARGGLTADEKKAAKELLAARLTASDWAELMAIYEKYK